MPDQSHRAGIKLDPTVLYQKSYPGSAWVTGGNLILGTKAGSERERKGHREKIPVIRIRDEGLASLGSVFSQFRL